MTVNIRYRVNDGIVLEAAFGAVAEPGAGETVVQAERMPRYHSDYPAIGLEMIQDGQLVAREVEEIAADIAAILAAEQKPIDAMADFSNLPGWAFWSGGEAADYIHTTVLNGMDKNQVNAWIDANIGGTTLAAVLTSVRAGFKLLAGAIIDLRTITESLAQAVMFLRDIARVR